MSSGLSNFAYHFSWSLISIFGMLISYYLIFILTLSEIAFEFFQKHIQGVSFANTYNNVIVKQKKWKSPRHLQQATRVYFRNVWKDRRGYPETNFADENLPYSFKSEMMIDVSWLAFQHSHLFNKQPLPFLREISKYIKQEFKLPGEMIYKRGQWKDKMIYIVSGTLQLLSEEDGESPILSLTSGSCFGDSCMIRMYPSRNNVRCKGFVELYTLKTCDLIRLYKKFSEDLSVCKIDIKWRYKQAMNLHGMVLESKRRMHGTPRHLDIYNLLWTKNTLHKHMSKTRESMRRHRFQNIYLINETNPRDFKQMHFTAYFLDTLAITERLEIETDTVFLKHSCPCILQPDSVIVYFWEFFVIVVTLFVAFLIPQKAFIRNVDVSWLPLIMFICTFIFCFDIYVQFSIGIISKDGTKGTFKIIAKEKMNTWGFWADLMSCFPMEVLKCIVYEDKNDTRATVLYINRLIKLWRIEKCLLNLEKRFNTNIFIIQFFRYLWTLIYAIYFSYCYLHMAVNVEEIEDIPKYEILFTAVQIITLTGINAGRQYDSIIFFYLNIISLIITILMQAHFIAACTLSNLKHIQIQYYVRTIYEIFKSKPKYIKRMRNYFNTQWEDNRCENILKSVNLIYELPKHLRDDMFLYVSKDRVGNLKLFQYLPKSIVHEMCSSVLKYNIYSPNQFLIKSGDISRMVILVYGGITEIVDSFGVLHELDSRPYAVNFVEAALRAPSAGTIITSTNVKVFYFYIDEYEDVLKKHYDLWKDYEVAIKKCADLRGKCREICDEERDINVIFKEKVNEGKSWHKFPHNIVKDSYLEYDFFIPYDKLYPFHGLRYFLLRTTFLPEGKFLFYWECFRCLFAFIACIIFFSTPFITRYGNLTIFLDLTCLADIYVRLHVCYYNEYGVLIYHPVKTSKYYLTHSFVIDCLGSLPFGYFSTFDAFGYFTLNFPRLFQLYRYIGFMKYLRKDPTKSSYKLIGFLYIPLCLVIINLLGAFMVTVTCVREIGTQMCLESIMIACPNRKWFNDVFIYVSGIYVTATSFMNFGMGVFDLRKRFHYYCIAIICVVGLFYKVITVSKLLPLYSFRQQRLLKYQEEMKSLKFFLKTINTHFILKKAIFDLYKLKWDFNRNRDIHKLTEIIIGTLRTDLIYTYYGDTLYQNCIFDYTKKRSFYRNFLNLAKYECYPQDGYILTINDVSDSIYVLYTGSVDVIAADGSIMAHLKPGGFFGNLNQINFERIKVSVIAIKPTEIMCVRTEQFYNLLNQYQKIKSQFDELRLKYICYIPSNKQDVLNIVSTTNVKAKWKKLKSNKFIDKIITWRLLSLFYCCYFAIILDLYQFGALDYTIPILTLQYISDLIYITRVITIGMLIYLKDFIIGSLKGKLKEKLIELKNKIFQKKNTSVIISMISLIPIDLLILYTMNKESLLMHILFSTFRLNRLLRLLNLRDFFRKIKATVNTNVSLVRICYIMSWLSLVWMLLTSTISLASCAVPFSILPPLPVCSYLLKISSWERFELYIKYFSLVSDILTFTGQHNYTPQHAALLAVFIIAKLISLFLLAICCSQIFCIVKDCSQRRISYRNFGKRIQTFLRLENVSIALVDRTMRYIELLWMRSKGCNYPELLKSAPLYLQDAILNDAYHKLIGLHPIFIHCHRDFIRQVIQKTKTNIYFNDDYIQFKGSISTSMYFIYKGNVKVFEETPTHDVKIKTLNAGESFGIVEGLYGKKKHSYTFQADGTVIVVSLEFEKWGFLLDFFPASKVRLYSMAMDYIPNEKV
ncbi:uncharacterized protein [Onthophagus taurus]|uniref:uncharacterized protein n=1 Tax=Onthophagus taurus TaxID=166361 RepID=UPI0039BDEE27